MVFKIGSLVSLPQNTDDSAFNNYVREAFCGGTKYNEEQN